MHANATRCRRTLHNSAWLFAAGLLVLAAAPLGADRSDAATGSVSALHLARSAGGKGLDKGSFELLQMHSPLPTAWVWVEDDTIDGSGVEYWALHGTYLPPGPGNDDLSLQYRYRHDQNHLSLQEFVDWIVASNPHVNDAGELMITQRSVAPMPMGN